MPHLSARPDLPASGAPIRPVTFLRITYCGTIHSRCGSLASSQSHPSLMRQKGRSHSAWAACDDGYVNRSGSWRYISRRFLSSSTPSLVKAMMGSSPVP
jgi:hypothetical protein